jgi:hypothetical protein
LPHFPDAIISFTTLSRLAKGQLSLDNYTNVVKISLSQGNYTHAHAMLQTIWRRFFGTQLRRYWERQREEQAKTSLVKRRPEPLPEHDSDLPIPTALELLKINQELAILTKFAEMQLEALHKVGVFSTINKRVYRIRQDGLIGVNNDYPAPEIERGRDQAYFLQQQQWAQKEVLQEEQDRKVQAQEELLDSVVDVKLKLFKFLQDPNVKDLGEKMKLDELFA